MGGGKEEGSEGNNGTGVRIGGGVGHGIKRGLRPRGGVSGSERVEWSGMEWVGRVNHLDRQWAGKTAGGVGIVRNIKT